MWDTKNLKSGLWDRSGSEEVYKYSQQIFENRFQEGKVRIDCWLQGAHLSYPGHEMKEWMNMERNQNESCQKEESVQEWLESHGRYLRKTLRYAFFMTVMQDEDHRKAWKILKFKAFDN